MDKCVGVMSVASYLPSHTITGEEIARRSGIPSTIVTEKMEIHSKTIP
ncbi:hypothetical protein [Geomicrobium sp. JCM 19039]|nr:hypothetical protein [Geomicrobium sp. JCM 19039]